MQFQRLDQNSDWRTRLIMGSSLDDLCRQGCNLVSFEEAETKCRRRPIGSECLDSKGGGSNLQADACKKMGVGWGMLQEVRVYKFHLHRMSGRSHLAMGRRKELLESWLGGLLLQERNLVSPFWLMQG